jgi:hypothetical protein
VLQLSKSGLRTATAASAALAKIFSDRSDERLGGYDWWGANITVHSDFHQIISESPEVVQQGCEREAEQPHTVVLRGRLRGVC